MIERYTRPEMGALFSVEARFQFMLKVEIAVAQVQANLGLIPRKAAKAIAEKSKIHVKRILEIEKETKHDVIAFVSSVAQSVGPEGRYLHFGMTSSDVLDTALSLQLQEAWKVFAESLRFFEKAMVQKIKQEKSTLCAGRTHGMFAEPTTYGFRLAGFYAEFLRNRERLEKAFQQMAICKLSGAVGTYSSQPPEVEQRVARKLGLVSETIATQVVPRDRLSELMSALALFGSGLERLAVDLRHLQRSEVGEVTEGFSRGQKGSSAMPHKKNPISAENITGLSRLLRAYAGAALEDVSLWHERDISHSSVERVILPDALILADYMTYRMAVLMDGLQVHRKRMLENIELSQGQLWSSQVLLALVEKGLSREEAYVIVQRLCHSLGKGDTLARRLKEDPETSKLLKSKEVQMIFSGKKGLDAIQKKIKEVLQ